MKDKNKSNKKKHEHNDFFFLEFFLKKDKPPLPTRYLSQIKSLQEGWRAL